MKADLTPFGDVVRKLRFERRMVLRDLALKMGKSVAFLSAVETGRKPIPEGFAREVAEAFNLGGERKALLLEAAEKSVMEYRINVRGGSQQGRELASVFARAFPELGDDECKRVRNLIEELKHERTRVSCASPESPYDSGRQRAGEAVFSI